MSLTLNDTHDLWHDADAAAQSRAVQDWSAANTSEVCHDTHARDAAAAARAVNDGVYPLQQALAFDGVTPYGTACTVCLGTPGVRHGVVPQ